MDQNSQTPGDKKVGPIISTLVIVLILIIAALYIFASRVTQPTLPTDDVSNETAGSVQPVAGTSTSLQSIQNDLSSSTEGLDNQNF